MRRITSSVFVASLLAVALLLGAPSEARAQIVFDLQLSERGQEMVTDPDRMSPEELLGIVGEHGAVTYRGERPVEGELVAYFLPGDGERMRQARLGKFVARVGHYQLAEFLPEDRSLALFEELFPDGSFAAKELTFITGFGSFFPCSTFDPEGHDSAVGELVFDKMDLERGEGALVLAVHPEHDAERERVQIRPISLVFSSRD